MGSNREIWLAAGALSTLLSGQAMAADEADTLQIAAAPEQAGVAGLVVPSVSGSVKGSPPRTIHVKDQVFRDERLVTGPEGRAQIILLDQSNLTLGPNAELVIDSFVYDPETSAGSLAMSLTKGSVRFVGGAASKQNPVDIKLPVGTVGIRGGMAMISMQPDGSVQIVFLYGEEATVTPSGGGAPTTLFRHGFMTTLRPDGSVDDPSKAPASLIASLLAVLEGSGLGTVVGSNQTVKDEPLMIEFNDPDLDRLLEIVREAGVRMDLVEQDGLSNEERLLSTHTITVPTLNTGDEAWSS